jgi:lipoate-protein ligase A
MSELWRIIVDGVRPAGEQMARDVVLAAEAQPIVRFFWWKPPAVSLGWKQPSPSWVTQAPQEVAVVERPTGGGIALHGSDLSVSVVVPRELGMPLRTIMETVCACAVKLCQAHGAERVSCADVEAGPIVYCLTEPSPYAVYLGARKVAGFALRRYPRTWLIQGSLLVAPLPAALAAVLPRDVRQAFEANAVSLAEATQSSLIAETVAATAASCWTRWWEAAMVEPVAAGV